MMSLYYPPQPPVLFTFYREAGLTIDDVALRGAGITVLSSGWYFWIEGWEEDIGPYSTEEECKAGFEEYIRSP